MFGFYRLKKGTNYFEFVEVNMVNGETYPTEDLYIECEECDDRKIASFYSTDDFVVKYLRKVKWEDEASEDRKTKVRDVVLVENVPWYTRLLDFLLVRPRNFVITMIVAAVVLIACVVFLNGCAIYNTNKHDWIVVKRDDKSAQAMCWYLYQKELWIDENSVSWDAGKLGDITVTGHVNAEKLDAEDGVDDLNARLEHISKKYNINIEDCAPGISIR